MCREAERKKEISRKGAKRQRSKWRDVNGEKQEATDKWAISKWQMANARKTARKQMAKIKKATSKGKDK